MRFVIIFLLMFSSLSYAGGWSNRAIPTRIDVVPGKGIMVYGNFGNPANCTNTIRFFVPKEHAEYDKVHATILAAFMAGKKIDLYAHTCKPVGWYSSDSVTYNTVNWGAVNISN